MLDLKKVKEVDSKLNYIIGYRQLPNLAVVAAGFIVAQQDPQMVGFAILMIVCGLKWYMDRVYRNVDAIEIGELEVRERK